MLTRASKRLSAVTSFPVQYNKAIVGRNAFAHESGIHQDGMLKNAETYEIMTPESVGVSKTSLVMGKHSGRAAFKDKLRDLGYTLGDNALQDAFKRFKDLADRKKHVYDEDIVAIVDEEIGSANERVTLEALTSISGTAGPSTATLTLAVAGAHRTTQATGNGPVDAIFNGIRALEPHEAELELFQIHAVTEGTDAQGRSDRPARRGGSRLHGSRRRSRHDGGLRSGLPRGSEQAPGLGAARLGSERHEARLIRPTAAAPLDGAAGASVRNRFTAPTRASISRPSAVHGPPKRG